MKLALKPVAGKCTLPLGACSCCIRSSYLLCYSDFVLDCNCSAENFKSIQLPSSPWARSQALWELPRSSPWALLSPHYAFRGGVGSRGVAIDISVSGLPIVATEGGCLEFLDRELKRMRPAVSAATTLRFPMCAALLGRSSRQRCVQRAQGCAGAVEKREVEDGCGGLCGGGMGVAGS